MTSTQNLLSPSTPWSGKIYDGRWKDGGNGRIAVTEKATAEIIAEAGAASVSDVRRAAEIAKEAQKHWAEVPGPKRGDILREFSRLLLLHADEVAEQLVRETGSIRGKGYWEVHTTAREVMEAAALGSQPIGMLTATAEPGRRNIARRVPIGVIGIITPWNSPLILGSRAIGPALAMGNAVLLKPDTQTPIIGGVVFARLLEEAGLPPGLFHVLPGGGAEIGGALVREPLVDMISFTGSTAVGREIGAAAGQMLKRVSLELGGNNPYIVLEDADIDAAASAGAWGAFFHQGQICLTAGRHLAHVDIADQYAAALVARAEQLKIGNPIDPTVQIGPVANERQASNVERIIRQTVEAGATILTGGKRNGLFIEPTVITGVRPGMAVFNEETFGPVAPITTFSSDEEAIELANLSEYGLVAAVVSPNLARAQRIADKIHTGIVHINDQTVLHDVFGPIGGVGASGNGFNHSALTNADQFSEWQWMTVRDALPEYPF